MSWDTVVEMNSRHNYALQKGIVRGKLEKIRASLPVAGRITTRETFRTSERETLNERGVALVRSGSHNSGKRGANKASQGRKPPGICQ
jgi:hypothetical protein